MTPEKIDPNNSRDHPVLAFRAEGRLGFFRSSCQLAAGVLFTFVALFGVMSIWWLFASIPMTLFTLVEVVGALRYRHLVRLGLAEPVRSRLE